MFSYRFWRLLTTRRWKNRHPIQSTPLFLVDEKQLLRRNPLRRNSLRRNPWRRLLITAFTMVAFLILIRSGLWMLFCLAPFLFLLGGTVFGVTYAAHISVAIVSQHEKKRYDLISVSPVGREGLHWIACPRIYYRHGNLQSLNTMLRGAYFFIGLGAIVFPMLGILVSNVGSGTFRLGELQLALVIGLPIFLVMMIFYLDVMQSILFGCVMGMLMPTYVKDRVAAQALAVLGFLICQMVFYVTYYLLGMQLSKLFVLDDNWTNVAALFMYLASFYAIREAMINGLLYVLARRLDSKFALLKAAFEVYA